jgi:hypothetical protein
VLLESLDDLLRPMHGGDSSSSSITTVNGYLFSKGYRERVVLALREQLSNSLTDAK